VAGLRRQVDVGYSERTADGLTPDEQLRHIARLAQRMVADQYRCLLDELVPQLATAGVHLLRSLADTTPEDRAHLEDYFHRNVFPVLTPLAVDPAHPFPYISNLSLSLAVFLRGGDGEERFARVKVPKILPRWVALPGTHRFLPLEQLIGSHLESLFPGVEILSWHPFRITRNTDLQIDLDEAEDLLIQIQEEVQNRRFAEVSRLEVGAGTPVALRQLLLAEFNEAQEEGID
jgi:polyphosphate kinase